MFNYLKKYKNGVIILTPTLSNINARNLKANEEANEEPNEEDNEEDNVVDYLNNILNKPANKGGKIDGNILGIIQKLTENLKNGKNLEVGFDTILEVIVNLLKQNRYKQE